MKSKLIPGLLFIPSLAFLGLFSGTAVGSFFVPKGSSLAGPAIALSYGIIGLIIAMVAGALLVRYLSRARLIKAAGIAGVLTLLAIGWFTWRIITLQRSTAGPTSPPGPVTAPAPELTGIDASE